MKTVVTRHGNGPSLIRTPAARAKAGYGWLGKVVLIALGIVFASVGFTLVMTLDTPWAGAPMLVLGIYFFGKSFMDQRKKRRGADPAGEV